MSRQKGWCISKIGWCVGCNTTHLAKLPHFPSFFSLILARINRFNGHPGKIKLAGKLIRTQKSGVLVRQFLQVLPKGRGLLLGKR